MPKANEKLVESLFAARGGDLLRYLTSRLPNGDDAKDLAQETYESSVAQQQSVGALERVLRVMPPTRRQVVLMHRRDGMTYKRNRRWAEHLGRHGEKTLVKCLVRC